MGLALLICMAGIFSPHKLAGLEVMFVIQYAFISIIFIQQFIPLPIYCLRSLQYSVGYHYPFSEPVASPNPPQSYAFNINTEYFTSNFNFFGLTCVLPLIGILISKLVYSRIKEKEKKFEAEVVVELFHEMWMYACMFNLTYFTLCAVIFYQFGKLTDVGS